MCQFQTFERPQTSATIENSVNKFSLDAVTLVHKHPSEAEKSPENGIVIAGCQYRTEWPDVITIRYPAECDARK